MDKVLPVLSELFSLDPATPYIIDFPKSQGYSLQLVSLFDLNLVILF
jgi:hypothetical protein